MRNLLFVATSTSHASWLCLAFECTSCDPLGRTLIVCKDRIWGYPGNCQFSSFCQCMATASGADA
ncbi:DUF3551 domain-containing protein [Bradyrhizobium sp. 179]|uniref:DUF3551 domain-containing protein n=1 Tax=Bradyrhizobium sp. 179 TaxID=2782648 RepID=UPI001FFBC9D7|nr:DUF3551 domain-containing protein [Bradyrhizobium sp. 179]